MEEQEYYPPGNEVQIAILPPTNACGDVTDEDSGDEDLATVNNLPGSQLRAEAELVATESEVFTDSDVLAGNNFFTTSTDVEAPGADINDSESWEKEDSLPLSMLQNALKKDFVWVERDIPEKVTEWPLTYSANTNFTPTEIFNNLFDSDIIKLFVSHSNSYASKKNKLGNISEEEMRAFFGILLLSGYVSVPRRRMYWEVSSDSRNEMVAGALSRNRFEYILSNLHCCENDQLNKNDKFAKIRPLLDRVNRNFQDFAPVQEYHSIDESMVPYFGRHGCKQCIRGKPIRFGFKMWMGTLSGKVCNGYCVWLEPYQGKGKVENQYKSFGLGPSVVLQYCDVLKELQNNSYHIFFDNFFTTVPLLMELHRRNVRATGTIRENRVSKCPVKSKNAMKKEVRGSYDFRSAEDKVLIVKWHDNNSVNIATNNLSLKPLHHVSRYSQKENKRILIEQPHPIHLYNSYMGGVDRCDENISYYRTAIRGKKWYFCLIAYCLDLSVQNAWHLHKLQGGSYDQLKFRRQIAITFLQSNSIKKKMGRPSALENVETRFNSDNHFLISQEKQTRCRVCHKKVQKKCARCDVALHMDCFVNYHKGSEYAQCP